MRARATETSDHVAALEAGAARGGYRDAVSRLAAKREEEARGQAALDPAYLALLYHDAGDDRGAFEWMDRAAEDGDPNLIAMPTLAPDLRQVPQFKALMRRIRLPD